MKKTKLRKNHVGSNDESKRGLEKKRPDCPEDGATEQQERMEERKDIVEITRMFAEPRAWSPRTE